MSFAALRNVALVAHVESFSLTGTGFADSFTGGRFDDRFDGGGGADTARGGLGDDDLFGEAGNDSLEGGNGGDGLLGGAGNDTMRGGNGRDQLWGGDGNDRAFGDAGVDPARHSRTAGGASARLASAAQSSPPCSPFARRANFARSIAANCDSSDCLSTASSASQNRSTCCWL